MYILCTRRVHAFIRVILGNGKCGILLFLPLTKLCCFANSVSIFDHNMFNGLRNVIFINVTATVIILR